MKPEAALPCSQKSAIGHNLATVAFSSSSHTLLP